MTIGIISIFPHKLNPKPPLEYPLRVWGNNWETVFA